MSSMLPRRNDIVLPPAFQKWFKPSALASPKDINGIKATTRNVKSALRKRVPPHVLREAQERDEIHQWLENENATAIEVLERLAKSCSSYANLCKFAAEELSMAYTSAKAQSLIDLESKSKLDFANAEVEYQKVLARANKLKDENKELKKQIEKRKQNLATLNVDITHLNQILKDHPFVDSKSGSHLVQLKEMETKGPQHFSEEEYKALWEEQIKLEGEIEASEQKLSELQENQLKSLHTKAIELVKRSQRYTSSYM